MNRRKKHAKTKVKKLVQTKKAKRKLARSKNVKNTSRNKKRIRRNSRRAYKKSNPKSQARIRANLARGISSKRGRKTRKLVSHIRFNGQEFYYENEVRFSKRYRKSKPFDDSSIEEIIHDGIDFFFEKFPNAKRKPRTKYGLGFLIRYQRYTDSAMTKKDGHADNRAPNVFLDDPEELGEAFFQKYVASDAKKNKNISQYRSIAVCTHILVYKTIDGKRAHGRVVGKKRLAAYLPKTVSKKSKKV